MKRAFFLFAVTFVLTLTSCNLPLGRKAAPGESQPAAPAPVGTAPQAPVEMISPEPAAGTMLRWYDGSTLVYIPSGEFLMGYGGLDNPEHKVTMDGFWIYRTKVTNGMYARCVAANKCTPPGPDTTLPDYIDPSLKDRPVVGVTWEQANTYCGWVDGRLATEAEWEKTARGPKGKLYPWGDAQPSCTLSNHANCVGTLTNVLEYPDGVSEYKAFDFSGNAFEWVGDWYKATYYSEAPAENPVGPETGDVRSVRGSAFSSTADQIRPSTRSFLEPQKFRPDLSFRCVVENPQDYAPPCEVSPFVGEPATGPGGNGSPGGAQSCEPPPLDVSVTTYCQNKLPYANVNLGGASSVDQGGADCSSAGDLIVCTGTNNQTYTMSACTTCEPPAPEPGTTTPSCPPGFTYNAAGCACIYQPGSSPSGMDCPSLMLLAPLVPEQQCCQIQPPSSTIIDAAYCEPGYIPSGCTCVSGTPGEAEIVQVCKDFTVSLPECKNEESCHTCGCYHNANACRLAGCTWNGKTCEK